MKKLIYLTVFLLMLEFNATMGQYNNNFWPFGDSVLISWNSLTNPVLGNASFYCRNGSCSIGDNSGLIIYSGLIDNTLPNNAVVWNKYNRIIPNADYLFGSAWYHAGQLIPDPGNDSMIYCFTIGVTSAENYGFYYSTVNYKANNDSGVVIQKNVQLNNFPAFDALMSVKHGNGRDWWVIFQRWYAPNATVPSDTFYVYLVSQLGISGPFKQNIGSNRKTGGGQLVFNNYGNQFSIVSWMGLIELYNFDRCSGLITSTIPIEQEPATAPYPHAYTSCAFSPDDSKLYVLDYSQTNAPSYLYQFDLNSSNIPSSKLAIDSFMDPAMGVAQMKLAPDGKIYISATDENFAWPYPDTAYTTINNNLSVINYPDSLGAACDFQPFSFNLGTGRSYYGLPNNPNYELGAWVGSPCDTLSVGVENLQPQPIGFFQAWYNHEWDMVHVNASGLKGSKGSLRLVDMDGRVVYEKNIAVIPGGYVATEIPVNNFASGIYIVSLVTEKETLSYKVGKL